MNWIKDIERYEPFNEQETKDKSTILYLSTLFDDLLTRQNEIAHVTCSGFVVNEERTHVLMIHHNLYNAWGWTGGHADGESDFLQVAMREVTEETGVKNLKVITPSIFSVDVLTVNGHVKKGQFVSGHLHLNVTYLFEASQQEALVINEQENSDVAWIPVQNIEVICNEAHMIPLYNKIISKIQLHKL